MAICHIVNAVGCKNFGLSSSPLAEKYPYADIYGKREQLYNLNRARVASRDKVGTARIFKVYNKPFIICMVAHYAPGDPTDTDPKKQETLKTSTDKNYVEGLTQVTLGYRLKNLLGCIDDLGKKIPHLPV